jgi:Tfp pilus assembly protein PilO
MRTLLDKLNLRPQERRLVVMAVAVLAVVLHFWFVQPYFREWGRVKEELDKVRRTLKTYQAEIARTNEYEAKRFKLEIQGSSLPAEQQAQANILIGRIQAVADQSKLSVGNLAPLGRSRTGKTNEFFEEQTISLTVNPSGPQELVDFLYAIGSGDLLVRVKELSVNPDASQTKLMATMKLVASFQRKTPAALAPVKPGAAKPAALSSTKP